MAGGRSVAVLGPGRRPVGLEQLLFDPPQCSRHRHPTQGCQQPVEMPSAPEPFGQVHPPQGLVVRRVPLDAVGIGALTPILHRSAEIGPRHRGGEADQHHLVAG
jgi:hypothetical protein